MNKEVEDGSSIIYVNCAYLTKHPIPSSELEKLIHDFQCNKVEDLYSDEIRKRMIDVREDGVTTMSEWAEGIYDEAIKKEKMSVIQNFLSLNTSLKVEDLSKLVGLPVDKVNEVIKKVKNTDN